MAYESDTARVYVGREWCLVISELNKGGRGKRVKKNKEEGYMKLPR